MPDEKQLIRAATKAEKVFATVQGKIRRMNWATTRTYQEGPAAFFCLFENPDIPLSYLRIQVTPLKDVKALATFCFSPTQKEQTIHRTPKIGKVGIDKMVKDVRATTSFAKKIREQESVVRKVAEAFSKHLPDHQRIKNEVDMMKCEIGEAIWSVAVVKGFRSNIMMTQRQIQVIGTTTLVKARPIKLNDKGLFDKLVGYVMEDVKSQVSASLSVLQENLEGSIKRGQSRLKDLNESIRNKKAELKRVRTKRAAQLRDFAIVEAGITGKKIEEFDFDPEGVNQRPLDVSASFVEHIEDKSPTRRLEL